MEPFLISAAAGIGVVGGWFIKHLSNGKNGHANGHTAEWQGKITQLLENQHELQREHTKELSDTRQIQVKMVYLLERLTESFEAHDDRAREAIINLRGK